MSERGQDVRPDSDNTDATDTGDAEVIEEVEAEVVEDGGPWASNATTASTASGAVAPRRTSWASVALVALLLLAAAGVAATWATWPRLALVALRELPQPVPGLLDAGAAAAEQVQRLAAQQAALRERVELLEFAGRDAAKQLSALTDQAEQLASRAAEAATPDVTAADLVARLAAAEAGLGALRDSVDARLDALAAATTAATTTAAGATEAEVATLAAELQALQDSLAESLAAVRADTEAGLRAASDSTGDALRAEIEALRDGLQALSARLGTPAPLAELDRTQAELAAARARLAELDRAEAAAQDRIATLEKRLATLENRAATPGPDARREALVLATAQLRQRVLDGTAYAAALQAASSVAGDDAALAPLLASLEARADSGVPTRAALQEAFPAMARTALRAADGTPEGMLDRTWQRLGDLVTVRRTGDVAGDSPEAILARSEARLTEGDLAAATAELRGLSGPAGEAAAAWLADAEARLAAEQAVGDLQRRAIAAVAAG